MPTSSSILVLPTTLWPIELIDAKPTTPITFGLAGLCTLLSDKRGHSCWDTQVPGVYVPILSVRNLLNQGWKVDFAKNVIQVDSSTFPTCTNGLPLVCLKSCTCHTLPLGSNAYEVCNINPPLDTCPESASSTWRTAVT